MEQSFAKQSQTKTLIAPIFHTSKKEKAGCLHELFEAAVDARPESLALICEDKYFSYRQLEYRANQLARFLNFYDIGPGKFVALYFNRSELPIVAILACLKAGAAYVPIDPIYPSERIRHIIEESGMSLVLTEHHLSPKAKELFQGITRISIDSGLEEIEKQPGHRLSKTETQVTPSDLCYVIYTSGTTGRPKGVMAEHRHVAKFAVAFNKVCKIQPGDRIYQGFSLSFDGSVEEIWMAFSNASTLVVGTRETPKFGNELARFLIDKGITYFSTVPTLLSTITNDIPTLRYLVLSGEICPTDLVAKWARDDLQFLNVYGPTEATVNTTVAVCKRGQPITIGRPLDGYRTYILNEKLRPVPAGDKGELFIAGDTLSRGYLNRADLTSEKFVVSPYVYEDRLYRTGDLVLKNEDGELEFFGRIDTQIKIRGFRVELSEIEAVLRESENIQWAAIKLFEQKNNQELAAFVVLKDSAVPLDREKVLTLLKERLPEYMIPAYLDVVDGLPMLASGKIDRSKLPEPLAPLVKTGGVFVAPETDLETKIALIWSKIFMLPQISVLDDFFLDLGGHSLLAAQMVTLFRAEIEREVALRDVYRFPTVRALAHFVSKTQSPVRNEREQSSGSVFESLSPLVRHCTAFLQAISILGFGLIAMIPFCFVYFVGLHLIRYQYSWPMSLLLVIGISTLIWPFMLTLSVAAKWCLIGRYKPGKYKLWSFYYFRFWLATRLQAASGAGAFVGTPMLPFFFRIMGAKVGKNCLLETAACSAWDLVQIGDDVSIGADTQLPGYRVADGMLEIGSVTIGNRCFVGIHSALGLNSKMHDESKLDDQSLLPDGQEIGPGESRRGSPAQLAEVVVPKAFGLPRSNKRIWFFGAIQFLILFFFPLLYLIPTLPLLSYCVLEFMKHGTLAAVIALGEMVPVGFLVYCLFVVLLKWIILPSAAPGIYSIESAFYLRKWICDGIIKGSRAPLLPLYTTMYFPTWLRMLGAKVGAFAELSSVWSFSPELLVIGKGSFFADGSIIGGKRIHSGNFEIGENRIGDRSFVGNSAILPVGSSLGDRCLLGVLSSPPITKPQVDDGTEWLGCPSFSLPNRKKITTFDDSVTYRPTPKLLLQRAIIDGMRILIPGYIGLTFGLAGLISMHRIYINSGLGALFWISPLIGLATAMGALLSVVAMKWLVMGRFTPVIKPLWSPYVWLNEMINGAYESIMAPILIPFLGTPFVAPLLRLIGCKIGKHTYIESTLFSEFDLVDVGDHAALNAGSIIQTHLFEDRVMKSSYLKVGDECSVGNMAVVLYDTEMGRGASLAPLSLLMKGERLAPNTRWHGIPTTQIG
jgi:non-ribosomal peptide synthetase-like protein